MSERARRLGGGTPLSSFLLLSPSPLHRPACALAPPTLRDDGCRPPARPRLPARACPAGVTEVLCEAVGALAPHLLDRSEPEYPLPLAGDADAAAAAAPARSDEDAEALSPDAARRRLEVFPQLLHLLGRIVADGSAARTAERA